MVSEEAEAWLILNNSTLSPGRQRLLVDTLGSAQAVVGAGEEELAEVPGMTREQARRVVASRRTTDLAKLRELCLATGTHLVSYQGEEYPALLGQIPEPPPLLFVQGQFTRDDHLAVAIVGDAEGDAVWAEGGAAAGAGPGAAGVHHRQRAGAGD